MAEPADQDRDDRLKALDDRIRKAKGETAPRKRHQDEHYSQAHLAWRMVIELVAGLLIGFGIGFGLDTLFGTAPIFLVLFILLGLAAGIRVMLRSAREIGDESAGDPPRRDGEDEHG